jgi:hypothetical protein
MNYYIHWVFTGCLVVIVTCVTVFTIIGTVLTVREMLRDFRK